MAVITATELLRNGVHFGHQTRRWNPKMKRFIFTERNGIYIIDLHQTVACIDATYSFVRDLVAQGGQVLFVGTKKQAQEAVADQANRVGMPYVNQRWLGGMLTNFPTMSKRIERLKELEARDLSSQTSGLTKKELLGLSRERDKLAKSLGGIRDMGKLPSAVWIVDTKKEHLAVDEARKLKIPVIAILDTNCDPDEVDYPIPGNDDAIRAVSLLTKVVADAVADGLMARSRTPQSESEAEAMPDWERELLVGSLSSGPAPSDQPPAAATAAATEAAQLAAPTPPVEAAPAEAAQPAEAAPAQPVEAAQAAAPAATAQAVEDVQPTPPVEAAPAEPAQPVEAVQAADQPVAPADPPQI
ncbi:MAG: 30S ribosomal protein S2 [Propionibacteriaceae bacterium]|jgi:small subunit ribosomal protein S2|nr:30S ribosomal protein S2 [Propionibacteriaceae bacterium]